MGDWLAAFHSLVGDAVARQPVPQLFRALVTHNSVCLARSAGRPIAFLPFRRPAHKPATPPPRMAHRFLPVPPLPLNASPHRARDAKLYSLCTRDGRSAALWRRDLIHFFNRQCGMGIGAAGAHFGRHPDGFHQFFARGPAA